MNDEPHSLRHVLDTVSELLTNSGIEHILIGGIAIGLRGYPRATADVDYLVNGAHAGKARKILEENGFLCEVETDEMMHFTGNGSVDFLIAKRPPSLRMLKNATKLPGVPSDVALVEDIIGLKIQAYCNEPDRKWKDQADIAELVRTNPDLDWRKVLEYARIFDQEEVLREIKAGIRS